MPRKGIAGPYGNSIFNFFFLEEFNTLSVRTSLLKLIRILQMTECVCPASSVQWALFPGGSRQRSRAQPTRKAEPGWKLILLVPGSRRERPLGSQREEGLLSAWPTPSILSEAVADAAHLKGLAWGKGRISQPSVYWQLTLAAVPGQHSWRFVLE